MVLFSAILCESFLRLLIFGAYLGAPEPPSDVVGEGIDSSVSLSWADGPINGGLITRYIVTEMVTNKVMSFTVGEVRPAVFTGLSNLSSYKFKVAAENAFGVSLSSSETSSIIPVRKFVV